MANTQDAVVDGVHVTYRYNAAGLVNYVSSDDPAVSRDGETFGVSVKPPVSASEVPGAITTKLIEARQGVAFNDADEG